MTPTINRKQIATSVAKKGTDSDVRATASYLSHNPSCHSRTYIILTDAHIQRNKAAIEGQEEDAFRQRRRFWLQKRAANTGSSTYGTTRL